jgi:putative sporulation protein YtxC
MELFTVSLMNGLEEQMEKLYCEISLELDQLHNDVEGVTLSCTVNSLCSDLTCTASLPGFQLNKTGPAVYKRVGAALSEYVLKEHENGIIRNIIVREYNYDLEEDIRKIEKYCMQMLDETYSDDRAARLKRKAKMAEQFRAYLEENTYLNINGFVRFRLHDYIEELHEVVEYAIDEYLMEKQYQEFISLLKYFVYIQDAKIPAAHLMHKGENDFELLNERLEPIETKQMDGFVVEMVDKEISYEDMIVSTLITVSPQKVYIHTREPEMQVIKTIQQIFEERANLCTYCASCRPILGDRSKKGKLSP